MTWFWVSRALVLATALPFFGLFAWFVATDPPVETWRRLRWPMAALAAATLVFLHLMPR